MSKDKRLYARFTLDFADSPKIVGLSDSAFRTLVEMVLWSRRMLTDGFIRATVAHKLWPSESLSELLSNDVARPSLARVEHDGADGYMIHDFLAQQDSREEVEARKARNQAAGRAGGLAKAKRAASKSLSDTPSEPVSENVAKTETETSSSSNEELPRPRNRGSRLPPDFSITDDMRQWATDTVPGLDVDAVLPEFVDYWTAQPGQKGVKTDWVATWRNGMRKQAEWRSRGQPQRKLTAAERNLQTYQEVYGSERTGSVPGAHPRELAG